MKSSALLPSNLPSVIDRSNLSPSREASALISGNKALFVSVDLIGEKNLVILELQLNTCILSFLVVFYGRYKYKYMQIVPSYLSVSILTTVVNASMDNRNPSYDFQLSRWNFIFFLMNKHCTNFVPVAFQINRYIIGNLEIMYCAMVNSLIKRTDINGNKPSNLYINKVIQLKI